jgi:glutathione peroxidase
MTIRQRILKWVYPLFVALKKGGRVKNLENPGNKKPAIPFHSLSVELIDGKTLPLSSLKGKKVLLVNTASDCGYTAQYTELQQLYQHSRDELEIIAFPSNDFKEQEKKSEQEIEQFCRKNYGVSFPITRKTIVVKSAGQHPIFEWLTHARMNGWNDQSPVWNFSKFLVDEEGMLTHYFDPAVSPLSPPVTGAIHH